MAENHSFFNPDYASELLDLDNQALKNNEEANALIQSALNFFSDEEGYAFFKEIGYNMEAFQRLITYYECAMMEIETKFRVLDAEFGMQHDRNPIDSIKTRLKTPKSLAEKMARKGFPMSIESVEKNIFDVAGVRVVCSFTEDIFLLADALLAQDDVHLVERRDYVSNPKPSGYRSLHLIVETPIFLHHDKRLIKVEVQLRTISMNFWATLEHQLRYKKHLSDEDEHAVSAELLRVSETAALLDDRMQIIRDFLDKAD